jgi:hypothetical protein
VGVVITRAVFPKEPYVGKSSVATSRNELMGFQSGPDPRYRLLACARPGVPESSCPHSCTTMRIEWGAAGHGDQQEVEVQAPAIAVPDKSGERARAWASLFSSLHESASDRGRMLASRDPEQFRHRLLWRSNVFVLHGWKYPDAANTKQAHQRLDSCSMSGRYVGTVKAQRVRTLTGQSQANLRPCSTSDELVSDQRPAIDVRAELVCRSVIGAGLSMCQWPPRDRRSRRY